MALSQIVWNHMTGTEDQLFEDCMKLRNEPKRVGTYVSVLLIYLFYIC